MNSVARFLTPASKQEEDIWDSFPSKGANHGMELSPAWWGTPAIQVLRRQKQENHGCSDSLVYTASPAVPTPRPWEAGGECIFQVFYLVTNLQQHCKLVQLHSSYNQEFQKLESCPSSPSHWVHCTGLLRPAPCSPIGLHSPIPAVLNRFVCLFVCVKLACYLGWNPLKMFYLDWGHLCHSR